MLFWKGDAVIVVSDDKAWSPIYDNDRDVK